MENSQSIKKKCHLFLKHLKPLSAGFNDSTIIQFNANIGCDYDVSNFGDPLQILNHLRNELLPIFSTARCYEFLIRFFSHGASVTNTLDSILQMPQIISSTNVKFSFYRRFSTITTQFLPVAAISAWLDRSFNGMIIKSQKQQKSPLELTVYIDSSIQVQSVFELFENLKKTFTKAESPRQPFIFSLRPFLSEVLQDESLANEKTKEELSIKRDAGFCVVSLKKANN